MLCGQKMSPYLSPNLPNKENSPRNTVEANSQGLLQWNLSIWQNAFKLVFHLLHSHRNTVVVFSLNCHLTYWQHTGLPLGRVTSNQLLHSQAWATTDQQNWNLQTGVSFCTVPVVSWYIKSTLTSVYIRRTLQILGDGQVQFFFKATAGLWITSSFAGPRGNLKCLTMALVAAPNSKKCCQLVPNTSNACDSNMGD